MASESNSVPYMTDESHFVSYHRAHRSFKSEPNTDSSMIISFPSTRLGFVSNEDQVLTSEPRPSCHRSNQFKLSSDLLDSKPSPKLSSFTRTNNITSRRQDVLPLNHKPRDNQPAEISTRQNGTSRSGIHSSSSSPLNRNPTPCLGASPPVFHNVSDLAAHHGIPQSLPPAPRTIPSRLSTGSSTPHSPDMPSLSSLCSDYLNMLSADPSMSKENQTSVPQFSDAQRLEAIMDVIIKSSALDAGSSVGHPPTPMGLDAGEDFLTSPMESPFADFLSTPIPGLGDYDHDLTSPLIADDNGTFYSSPLFAHESLFDPQCEKRHGSESSTSLSTVTLDGLYMMSPATPAFDSLSMTRSSLPLPITRLQNVPNGTRKNITPESLIPVDAPVQSRRYVTPSATSRKDEPAKRKRDRSQAFDDDDNEEDASLGMELDGISAKRLQNTLAARRSRKRKLEYQRELENTVEQERAALDRWRARALTLEALLTSHGIPVPPPLNI